MLDERALYIEIGDRIRKARKLAGLNQSDLASLVGLERTSITNIEKGRQKVSVAAIYNICSSLQIDLETLLPNLEDYVLHSIRLSTNTEEKVGSKTLSVLENYRKKFT